MPTVVLVLVLLGFAVSLPATGLLVRWGRRTGALDSAGAAGHEKTLRNVPNVGGIGIALATLGPMIVGLGAVWIVDADTWSKWIPAFAPHLERVRATTPTAVALIAASPAAAPAFN